MVEEEKEEEKGTKWERWIYSSHFWRKQREALESEFVILVETLLLRRLFFEDIFISNLQATNGFAFVCSTTTEMTSQPLDRKSVV